MKAKLLRDGSERTFALVFDTGEEVVAALLRFARGEKLTGAHLTAIGAFQRVTLGFFRPGEEGIQTDIHRGASRAAVARGEYRL